MNKESIDICHAAIDSLESYAEWLDENASDEWYAGESKIVKNNISRMGFMLGDEKILTEATIRIMLDYKEEMSKFSKSFDGSACRDDKDARDYFDGEIAKVKELVKKL